MSKAIRITLIVIAVLCVPPIIFPQIGLGSSEADPAAVLVVTGLAAILWPSSKAEREKRERRDSGE